MSDTAYVRKLPDCDIHTYDKGIPGVPAAYDAPTRRGPWASMCTPCWKANRAHADLGTGRGQRYIVGEKPHTARDDFDAALAAGNVDAMMDAVGDGDFTDYL